MLPIFLAFALSTTTLTVKAIDQNGVSHNFARISYEQNSNLAKLDESSDVSSFSNSIKLFLIERPDGGSINTSAPAKAKAFNFKLYLIDETLFSFEVTSSYRKSSTCSLSRSKDFQRLVYQKQEAQQEGGGGGFPSMIIQFALMFIVFNMFCRPNAAQAPQQ
ncbi:hypothetical protein TRFO_09222 [Tritrichomonas foetus]|uniref:Uncharacterized protein n=1 Tax=Tritrichomonas foetus TaxID=1144522 RepID=A0A1J4JKM7_9EUKA|nr:hypothetical protein TRFO_09222 [Tritrichomonas foetus]|eukprot:OHS97804.1 hypothetical protein TRFO_09222 [Tritrichomonas foetus]